MTWGIEMAKESDGVYLVAFTGVRRLKERGIPPVMISGEPYYRLYTPAGAKVYSLKAFYAKTSLDK